MTSLPTQKDQPMTTNDDQASALVAALAPLLAKTLMPQLTEAVEKQVKGIKAKNDELLDKLHNMQKDAEIADLAKSGDEVLEQAKRLLNAAPKKENGRTDFRKAGEAVRISRTDARDVAVYKKAKALAAEQGVALEIASDE